MSESQSMQVNRVGLWPGSTRQSYGDKNIVQHFGWAEDSTLSNATGQYQRPQQVSQSAIASQYEVKLPPLNGRGI